MNITGNENRLLTPEINPPVIGEVKPPALVGAGFFIRVLARFIDLLVHYAASLLFGLLIGVFIGIYCVLTRTDAGPVIQKVRHTSTWSFILVIIGYFVYHIICEGLHGSTLGKLICGLVVLKEDGSHCDLMASTGRTMAYLVDQLVLGFVAAASMTSSPMKQRLGDKLAHSIVVRRKNIPSIQLRSGWRFVVVFLVGFILDGLIIFFAELLKLVD
jgi:uncharacterized RDD family membrane protein YckC